MSLPRIPYALILMALICIAGYTFDNYQKAARLSDAQDRWLVVQRDAKQRGIHTELEAYLVASSGVGPSLFTDFPNISPHFTQDHQQDGSQAPHSFCDLAQLPNLKQWPVLSLQQTPRERIETLNLALTQPLPHGYTDAQVLNAVLKAIAPLHTELDQWKHAIQESNNLGRDYIEENYFFISASTFRNASNLLALRSYCHWLMGHSDTSDYHCLLKTSQLLYDYGQSLIALSVATAIDLQTASTANLTLQSPNISPQLNTELLKHYPNFSAIHVFHKALQTEYIVQLDSLKSLVEDTPHPFLPSSDALRKTPQYLLAEARADVAAFQLDTYFPTDIHSHPPYLPLEFDTVATRLPSSDCGLIAKSLISVLSIGSSYYFESATKADMTLELSHLFNALTVFKKTHGHFPNTLNALPPDLLSQIPQSEWLNIQYTPAPTSNTLPTLKATISPPSRPPIETTFPTRD
ncbi:hypothetical protein ACFSW8_12090 [Rubritalea tangerina]|uniref:Uncharacterized protein n=2 Tax=Rubritalea tangerina TaxID=430798 RepID=A0ABW4ZCC8_9BACT